MTVKAIRLRNFMAFEDSNWIDLSPVTLLFGLNSSGKSVLIRALRLLKQSIEYPAENDIFTYSQQNGIDVGSFLDMANGYDKKKYLSNFKKIGFGFRCDVRPEFFKYLNIDTKNSQEQIDLNLEYGWNPICNSPDLTLFSIEIASEKLNLSNKKVILAVELREFVEKKQQPFLLFHTDFSDIFSERLASLWSFVSMQFDPPFLPRLIRRYQSDEKFEDFDFIDRLLAELRFEIISFFRRITHIGAIRPWPSRLFTLSNWEQKLWEKQGLGPYLKLLGGEHLDSLNYWIEKLGFGEIENPRQYSKSSGKAIVTELSVNKGVKHTSLTDVGFGVSQSLPILMAGLLAEPNTLTIIEQPELHLHPAAQAELGDLFITTALKNNSFFLLETHSEHLILRTMKRIKQTYKNSLPEGFPKVHNTDIAVFVVSRLPGYSYSDTDKMIFSRDGELLTPWPGGFFEEDFNERFL